MAAPSKLVQIPLAPDEKSTRVIIYTDDYILWGDVVTKERIRVSTWLRTNAAPEVVGVYNATVLYPYSSNPSPMTFQDLHLATGLVRAIHLMPPANDPLDFDPNEANRKMEPITALVGSFRMDGSIRISTNSDLKKHLEISHEQYTSLYNVTISHPVLKQINLPVIGYVLVRQSTTTFASRNTSG